MAANAATKTKEQIALEALEAREKRSAELKAKRDEMRDARAGESKGDAFKRIAAKRTVNVLDAFDTLGNTFNKDVYEYTETQSQKIIDAIEAKVAMLKKRAAGEGKSKAGFEL
jgi:hypothetical protein